MREEFGDAGGAAGRGEEEPFGGMAEDEVVRDCHDES